VRSAWQIAILWHVVALASELEAIGWWAVVVVVRWKVLEHRQLWLSCCFDHHVDPCDLYRWLTDEKTEDHTLVLLDRSDGLGFDRLLADDGLSNISIWSGYLSGTIVVDVGVHRGALNDLA
jgi:hypothetical protein